MSTPLIPNHVEQAIARLLEQYRGKQTIEGLVTTFVTPLQELEQVFQDLRDKRTIDGSEGIQLDRLGALVGIERSLQPNPLDDNIYRLRIMARILVNISNGEPETLIQVFQLLSQSLLVTLYEEFPAGVSIFGDGLLVNFEETNLILGLLEEAALGGVRINALGFFDADEPFAFEGAVSPGLGFGSLTDPLAGGKFGGLYVVREEFAFDGDDTKALGFGSLVDPVVGGRFVGL